MHKQNLPRHWNLLKRLFVSFLLLRRDCWSIRSIGDSRLILVYAGLSDSRIERSLRCPSDVDRRSSGEKRLFVKSMNERTNSKSCLELVDENLGVGRSVSEDVFAEVRIDPFEFVAEIFADDRTIHLENVSTGRRGKAQFECSRLVDPTTKKIQLFLNGSEVNRETTEREAILLRWERLVSLRTFVSFDSVSIEDRIDWFHTTIDSTRSIDPIHRRKDEIRR